MSLLIKALAILRPGVNCSDMTGTLSGVRWDPPFPDGFTRPTQEEVDAEMEALANPAAATPKEKLEAATGLTVVQIKTLIAGK